MKINPRLFSITFLLFYFELSPAAHAVSPPPDGGYANFTTAEGQNALFNLTSGTANTGIGWRSLFSNTTGSFNTAVGAAALILNNGDENTAVGTAALLLNTASGNTAIGSRALLNNTTGGTLGNVQGIDFGPNVAIGQQALESNTVASANTAVGYQALHSFATGPMGFEQLGLCTAVGFQALANATGSFTNSAFGYQALVSDTIGGGNTAAGSQALFSNTTGNGNVAIGANALSGTNGDQNVALGFNAGAAVTTASNVISIGSGVFGENTSNGCYIGNIFSQTSASGVQVFVNSNNKLGTMTSSKRFKEDIRPTDKASEALFALKPVTFRYNKEIDPAATSQFGLVAEDVEKVSPDLVVRDKEGKAYSVRYDQVNAMLLNEFLKEHQAFLQQERKVAEQQATIAELKSTVAQQQKKFESKFAEQERQIEALTTGLQRMNAQFDLSQSVPKTAAATD